MHLVLEPRAMPHDLVAPCRRPSLAFRRGVRRPDLRQVAGRLQTGERAGIYLVCLDVSLRDPFTCSGLAMITLATKGVSTRDTPMLDGRRLYLRAKLR